MTSVINAVTEVFDAIGTWFGSAIEDMLSIFWTASEAGGSLTVLGVLAVASLGIAIILLILNFIKSFLRFQ